MTKQKKSFLDKIVTSEDAREFEEEKKVETDKEIESVDSKIDEVEKSFNIGSDEGKELKEEGDEKNEGWHNNDVENSSDEEGQLTVDVYKTKESIVIKSIIGGVRSDDLDISVTSDMVTIKGKRNNPDEVGSDDYYYQECFWGNFSRSIILPCDIKTEGVEATIKNGILTLKLPKIEKNSSMKIEVREE
ncbi:MAG: Hsp20/alpha crystallin family protein [Patescibacteria group bacterium]|nr:Hsp20/alpha crystallin family protein [Patescibacteria group bacterium]